MKSNDPLSARRQCELLGLNQLVVYYKPKQSDEETLHFREELMSRINYWHTTMPYLGIRRIAVKLRDEGYPAGRKLMRSCM